MKLLHRNSLIPAMLLAAFGCSPTVYNHGVPNLVQVEPGLWRSGQPTTTAQWQYIKSIGINRVVKLNMDTEGSDAGAEAIGMSVEHLGIEPSGDEDLIDNIKHTFVRPNPILLNQALDAILRGGGVLVHCTHGQDRTGIVIGMHRVLHDKWPRDAAYSEMLSNHFHPTLHGLHETWEDFHP